MIRAERISRHKPIYEAKQNAEYGIYESDNFFVEYSKVRNDNLGNYRLIIESKKRKGNNPCCLTCNTEAELVDYINNKTDIRVLQKENRIMKKEKKIIKHKAEGGLCPPPNL